MYSALEARVMAYVIGDPEFIKAVEKGNLHDVNTESLFHLTSADPMWKVGRAAAKVFQFGKIQFGGGDRTIYEKVYLAAPQLGLSFTEFQKLTERYFNRFKVFGQWREKTAADAIQTRKSYTAFGRVRHLYGHEHQIIKQAYNHPSQGTAGGIMSRVQAAALKARDAGGFRARLQVQIYDDLRWLVPDEEVDDLIKVVKPIMEQPFDIYGQERSFPTDIELAQNWGSLKTYKEKK